MAGAAWRAPRVTRRVVLVYRDQLLPPSEGFVLTQGEALRRYQAHYVGMEPGALATPPGRTWTVAGRGRPPRGDPRRQWFALTGRSRWLARQLHGLHPVLLHAHFGPDGLHAVPLARALGVPLLVTFHGYDVTASDARLRAVSLAGRRYAWRRRVLFARAARLLAVSAFVAARLRERGAPPEKVVVHHLGVDTARFSPSPAEGARSAVVLFVGRLVPVKGCHDAVRAMVLLGAAHPDAELVVLGQGPLRATLEAEAAVAGVRARFLGARPRDEVIAWMRRARVLVAPSVRTDDGQTEGFGLAVLEAQACGLPVVATRSGGLPEALGPGAGILVPERDPPALARALDTLLGDDAAWRRARAAGVSHARSLDLAIQTDTLERLYAEVAGGH